MPATTIAIIVVFLLLGAVWYWIFRPQPLLDIPEFKPKWRKLLNKHVTYYQKLDEADRSRFEDRMLAFLRRVRVTGIKTRVSELDRVLVAASGVIPTFGFEKWNQYPKLEEVLLYKRAFRQGDFATEGGDADVAGMVGGGYLNGKLLLSRPALRQGFKQYGRSNTGIHEFVHLLDKADGDTDGIPAYFLDNGFILPWVDMIRQEMAAIEAGDSDIDPYATTNKAEFFAVAAEYFFNRPHQFADHHPRIFALLERVFQQDLDEDGGVGTVGGETVVQPVSPQE